ncbi:hypothetical protein THAOC_18278, partial [Thalassiosira oceanica]
AAARARWGASGAGATCPTWGPPRGGGGPGTGGAVSSAPSLADRLLRGQQGARPLRPARSSARELPVWLISMFLLVHCEAGAVARCTSGSEGGRGSSPSSGGREGGLSPRGDDGSPSLDFDTLLRNRSALSPRTLAHAQSHANNAGCAAFLLRHLRKFLLLCAVPRNAAACRAVASLAAAGKGGRRGRAPPGLAVRRGGRRPRHRQDQPGAPGRARRDGTGGRDHRRGARPPEFSAAGPGRRPGGRAAHRHRGAHPADARRGGGAVGQRRVPDGREVTKLTEVGGSAGRTRDRRGRRARP